MSAYEEWQMIEDADDLLIYGPGHLEIVLRDFTSARTLAEDPLPPEVLGSLEQHTWEYELEDGITLQLISTRDVDHLAIPEMHKLHIGNTVSWEIPAAFAEQLHALPRRTN